MMSFVEKKRSLFFGLPWTFTTYTVNNEFITVNTGVFHKQENDCYMYKIVDTRLCSSFLERLFGLGTVHCFGGDVTDPVLTLSHIRNAKEIKSFILAISEEQRMQRRTLYTQNIADERDVTYMDPDM